MDFDKRRLFLVGISVFVLFIMGAVLAFKPQIKAAMDVSFVNSSQ